MFETYLRLGKIRSQIIAGYKIYESLSSVSPTSVAGAIFRKTIMEKCTSELLSVGKIGGILNEAQYIDDPAIKQWISERNMFTTKHRSTIGVIGILESMNRTEPHHETGLKLLNESLGKNWNRIVAESSLFLTFPGAIHGILNEKRNQHIKKSELISEDVSVFTPVALVHEGCFRINDTFFQISKDGLTYATPDEKFARISGLVEKYAVLNTKKNSILVENVEVSDEGALYKGITESRESMKNILLENLDKFGGVEKADAVMVVLENWEKFRILESFKQLENKWGDVALVGVVGDTPYLAVVEGARFKHRIEKFDDSNRLLVVIHEMFGLNLSEDKIFKQLADNKQKTALTESVKLNEAKVQIQQMVSRIADLNKLITSEGVSVENKMKAGKLKGILEGKMSKIKENNGIV